MGNLMKRHWVTPSLKYASVLPRHRQKEIVDLYVASCDELGSEHRERRQRFFHVLKLYFPFFNDMDLESAYSLIRAREQLREQTLRVERVHGAFGRRIVRLFGEWDEDGNGVVSLDEFRRAFRRSSLTASEVERCFRDADANGDGEVDLDELCRFMVDRPRMLDELERVLRRAEDIWERDHERDARLIFREVPNTRNADGTIRRPSLADVWPADRVRENLKARGLL